MFPRVGSDSENMTLMPLLSILCSLQTLLTDHRIIYTELDMASKQGDHIIYYANHDTLESERGHD